MAGKGSGGVLGAVAKIVSLVLVAAMLGAVIWYAIATNGFSDFNRITGMNQVMTETTTGVRLNAGSRTEFTVTNLNLTTSAPSYSVTIYFNSEEPVSFAMNDDGESYTTRGEEADLAEYFGAELTEDGFSVMPPLEHSEELLLQWLYPEASGIAVTSETGDADLYVMTVTFSDASVYSIYFNVQSLTLDPPSIIF